MIETLSSNVGDSVINADPWLRRSGLPYCALSYFRQMRVGDEYLLVDFAGPGFARGVLGYATVHLARERGSFNLSGIWTLHLGRNAVKRGHIWVPESRFRLLKGRRFELLPTSLGQKNISHDGMRLVAHLLCRAALLARLARDEGASEAYVAMHPLFFPDREGTEDGAITWLEKLRGPAFSLNT